MPTLGTKKFWMAAQGVSQNQRDNQILKNTVYINLQLFCVNYMSTGNFWQNIFGGSDKIALATNLKYQSGVEIIEATSVQDVREVRVNNNYNLGLQRNVAVKIPANADAISIDVKMTAVKDDLLGAKFDMLNKPEYQSALQLVPSIVGQVTTITSLVKKLFTDSDPNTQLEASYATIISSQAEDNPVNNGKLTRGWLIMISTDEGDPFNNVDATKFQLRGDELYYNNKQVQNTYLVFNISYDQFKGEDQKASWFRKYNDGLNNLDKIQLSEDQNEWKKILNDTKIMWIEGNALLDADVTYLNSEKINIKGLMRKSIDDKYKELTGGVQPVAMGASEEVIRGITGSTVFNIINSALPITSSFINEKFKIDASKPIGGDLMLSLSKDQQIISLLDEDSEEYKKQLKKWNLDSKLSFK